MSGFTKLFSTITESTVWGEDAETRIVWITLLAMADRWGRVHASLPGLAHRARVSLDQAANALELFMRPDRYSRTFTPECEGRRIEPIDGGWRLINYLKYRDLKDEEHSLSMGAERVRRWRERQKMKSTGNANVTIRNSKAEAEAEADKKDPTDPITAANAAVVGIDAGRNGKKPCPVAEIVALYHTKLPQLPRMMKITKARHASIRERWHEDNQDLEGWGRLFDYIAESDFLCGRTQPRNGSQTPFVADLEWICKPGNWAKIIEGRYHRE